MIKQYITQALAQLRQHPVISVVSVVGTALAIFLIMLVVMMQQVKTAPFAPESNRDRFLHAKFISIEHEKGGSSNGPLSEQTAKELYQSLKTPEAVTIYGYGVTSSYVSLPGQAVTSFDMLQTDDTFWQVFNFHFIEGKPYDKATFDASIPVAVLTETVARTLFGTTEGIVGKEFLLNHLPYKVCGVVKDVSTLATTAYAQLWIPYTAGGMNATTWADNLMGMMSCTILAKSHADFPAIREETDRRLKEYNKIIRENHWNIISRNRPYDQETQSVTPFANVTANLESHHRQQFVIFLILLIVPAINISSMTQSRLRQRVSEIGVRRAFGCTRTALMMQIIAENFIVTLIAGAFGLLMSVIFAFVQSHTIFAQSYSLTLNPPEVSISILLQWSTFLWAFFFCFILNLLSSGIPAWKASRTCIVNALNGQSY